MNQQMEYKIQQISFDERNQFQSSQSEVEQCLFCSQIDLLHCLQMSVMNKHSEIENFEEKLINKIIEGDSSSTIHKKFKDVIGEIEGQRLTTYYKREENKRQMTNLLEFYKFRKFIPRFAPNRQSIIVQSYNYQWLKLYYNQIKRRLNITVESSSQFTIFSSSQSITLSKNIQQTNLLQKLQETLRFQQTTGPTLQNYKTESKALQDLIHFLKNNPKMDQIPTFNIQPLPKQIKRSSKQIFRDFIQKNNTKSHNKNNIFITFFSKSNSIPRFNSNNHLKLLKSQNLIKVKQQNKNVQIFRKLQKIKNQILNEKVKQIIKLKTQDKNTPIRLKTIKRESNDSKKYKPTQKINVQNFSSEKKIPFRGQLKPLSKFKGKRSQSETKIKSVTVSMSSKKSLRSFQNNTMKNFLSGQKIQLEKQINKKQMIGKNLQNQRPLSQRKPLDLKKLKQFIKESQSYKNQNVDKKEDYLTQKYQNLVFETPKRFSRTTNVTPINSGRQKKQTNQIILQKNDNIISMKKKKLELMKKNMEHIKTERK